MKAIHSFPLNKGHFLKKHNFHPHPQIMPRAAPDCSTTQVALQKLQMTVSEQQISTSYSFFTEELVGFLDMVQENAKEMSNSLQNSAFF